MSSIKNTTNLYNLNSEQQKGLKMQLNKLDLNNQLILTLNKKIEKYPHNKVSDKLGGSLNQNIIFNFSNKNASPDRRLNNNLVKTNPGSMLSLINDFSLVKGDKNKKGDGKNAIKLLRSKVADLGTVQVKNPARLGITNNVVKFITSFFKGLYCLIGRPQFIFKTDKLIVIIFFYQNNFYKDALFSNNNLNFIYNLFNGNKSAKAQYSAPKSQNFASILGDMLGQTKWNKEAQKIFKNNEATNSLELASISKKVFILFIKDLMNLTSSNKGLSIEKALTQLQKGAPSLVNVSAALPLKGCVSKQTYSFTQRRNGLVGINKYNKLLMKLISSTNSESLTRIRTRLSKTFFNKSLLAKLQNKINKHNNSLDVKLIPSKIQGKKTITSIAPKGATELIGKGALMSPVSKAKLDKLLGWSSNNLDLSTEYKTIASALLVLLKNNEVINPIAPKVLQNVGSLDAKLANKIYKNLTSLSIQFADQFRNNANFIINNTPSFDADKLLTLKKNNFNLSSTFLKGARPSNILKIIKLINHNLIPSLGSKIGGQTLSIVKETLKAYSFILNKTDGAHLISSTENVNKFKMLGTFLSKIFQKNVELQLVKLYNVGLEETILTKVISKNAKFDKSSVIIKKLLRKISLSKASLIQFNKQNKILDSNSAVYNYDFKSNLSLPIFLNNKKQIGVKIVKAISDNKKIICFNQLYDKTDNLSILQTNPLALGKVVGLNIRIAGRLQKEPLRPKQTVKTVSVGTLSKERTNITSTSSFTSKNRKGTYRVTVKMAHIRTFSTEAFKNIW